MKSSTPPHNGDKDLKDPSSSSNDEEMNTVNNDSPVHSLRRNRSVSETSIWQRWYIWLALTVVLLALGTGTWFWFSNTPEADTVTPSATDQSSQTENAGTFPMPSKKERPRVKLVDPIEANKMFDLYEISNAQQVKLNIVAKKSTEVEIREIDGKGKVLSKKRLNNGDKLNLTHGQGFYVKLQKPNAVVLSINSVTIDTSTEKGEGTYQFRLAKGE